MTPSGNDHDGRRPETDRLDDKLKARLDEVNRRLAPQAGRGPGLSDAERRRRGSALGKAFRLSTELVAGVAVGGGLGWYLDRTFGTKPVLLVVLLLLGVAAGLLNAIRMAKDIGKEQ